MTRDIVHALALAALIGAPALAPSPASAEPAAQSPAPAKKAPGITESTDDLSAPPPAQAKTAPAGATAAATARDVAIGAAVYGSDGKKVGEVKGVKSEASGAVQEIHVSTGAKTIVVPGSKIVKAGPQIQLAMSSLEVMKLPTLPDNKG